MAEYVDIDAPIEFALLRGLKATVTVREIAAHNRAVLPISDVVEEVRCRECENWQSGWKPSAAKDGTHFCANVGLCTSADWFCADGERKDGGQDDV